MNITKVLSDEHQNILKVIDLVLNKCDETEQTRDIDFSFFKKVIDFIKNYADKFHHAKEEDILFKAMLNNIDNLHCNPIPVMLHEHDEGRTYVIGMEEGIWENNVELLLENTRGYCFLLQQHIFKEDNVLYPMAEESLNDAQKEMVNQLYLDAEKRFKDELNSEILNLINE